MRSKDNAARMRRNAASAARMRAMRQRKAQAAVHSAQTMPLSAPTGDDPVRGYLTDVLTWCRTERTPAAGRFAQVAASLLGQLSGPGASPTDLPTTIAHEVLAIRHAELRAGRADDRSIRAGLAAAKTLAAGHKGMDWAKFMGTPDLTQDEAHDLFIRAVAGTRRPPDHVMVDVGDGIDARERYDSD